MSTDVRRDRMGQATCSAHKESFDIVMRNLKHYLREEGLPASQIHTRPLPL